MVRVLKLMSQTVRLTTVAYLADQGVLEDSSKKLLKQVEDLQDVSACCDHCYSYDMAGANCLVSNMT